MAVKIHPTAVVDPKATLDYDVTIGPFCVVSGGAFIASGTELISNVTLLGNVRIGTQNVLHPFSVIGGEPQDKSYKGSPTWVVLGDRNVFREAVTIHRGSEKEVGVTRVGSDCYLMAGCHVAHDVVVGSHVMMANQTMLSGHTHVHDHAVLSGMIGVHHFTTIGSYSFVGGMARINMDVPPFMLVEGNPAEVRCVNMVGLRRNGFAKEDIENLSKAHRLIYRERIGVLEAQQRLTAAGRMTPAVTMLFDFLAAQREGRHGRAREASRKAKAA